MNYLVVGEPCVDLIHKADGGVIHSYGGILYSVLTLSVLAKKDDIVMPLMNLGEDEYDNITNILKKYTNISIESYKKWNSIVYLSNKSKAAAKVEADEKHPELRESRKLLEVIKSTLISIQYQLKNE